MKNYRAVGYRQSGTAKHDFRTKTIVLKKIVKKNKPKAYDPLGKDYVCPQCGPDPNGSTVHAETHHTF